MGGLLHLVQREGAWAGCGPAQSPPRCTKCSSPPVNGQCTNFILFDVAQKLPLHSKGLSDRHEKSCGEISTDNLPRRAPLGLKAALSNGAAH